MGVVLLAGCKRLREQEHYEVVPVEVGVQVLSEAETNNKRTYVGDIETATQVSPSFALGGKLTYIGVKNGDKIRKGDVIAKIDDQQQRNALRTAKAKLDQAKDAYQRMKKVWEQGAMAEVKWVEMQTALEQAQSMYDAAQKELADCTLRSPVSGQVDQLQVSVGQLLAPTQKVCTIVSLDDVSVHFSVPENEVSNLQKGQPVQVVVAALNNMELAGMITEIGLTANRFAHSYEVTAVLTDRQKQRLLPGMVCKVLLTESALSGIVIPASCVQTRPEGKSVWVIEEGVARRRRIEVNGFVRNGVLVSEGLALGDSLIVSGYQKLYTDAPVEAK